MSRRSPTTVLQGLLCLAMLPGLFACGTGDSGSGTPAGAAPGSDSATPTSAAPDRFIGDYFDRTTPAFRITRSGGRYEAVLLNASGAPTGSPAPEVDCDDDAWRELDHWFEHGATIVCFSELGDSPQPAVLHLHADPNVMEAMTPTGYAIAADPEVEPWDVRRQPPAGVDPILVGIFHREYNESSAALDAAFWPRLEFPPDGTIRAVGQDGFVSTYRIVEGVVRPDESDWVFRVLADGCLALGSGLRYCQNH